MDQRTSTIANDPFSTGSLPPPLAVRRSPIPVPKPGNSLSRAPDAGRRTPILGVLLTISLCLATALPGCSSAAPTAPQPGASPLASPSARPTMIAAQGTLVVVVTDGNGAPLSGAAVQVRGAATQDGLTDAQGTIQFAGLVADANYTVVVQAPGFGIGSRSPVSVVADKGTKVTVPVAPAASISGTVVGSDGRPLAAAVVSNGALSTLSGGDGSFVLTGVTAGTQDLTVGKTGFQVARKGSIAAVASSTVAAGTITLSPLGRPLQVLFDASKTPFGGGETLSSFFADLIRVLRGSGYQVTIGPTGGSLPDLSAVDILLVASPASTYSSSELLAIRSFVNTGHKLILLGEWGAFGGVSNSALNGLASSFNLAIGDDLVKDFDGANQLVKRADFLLVTRFVNHPLTSNVQSLALFESASVSVLRPPLSSFDANAAAVVARTGFQGLQVADVFNSNYGVAGAALTGVGTVVAIGDASLWSSSDSDGSGTPDLLKQNNKELALNAFGW